MKFIYFNKSHLDKHALILIGYLILIGSFIIQFIFLPFTISGDGIDRKYYLDHILLGINRPEIKYSIFGSMFSAPLYFLDLLIFQMPGKYYFLFRYNLLLVYIFIILTIRSLYHKRPIKELLIFSYIILWASMFSGHILNYYGEVFSAITAGLAIITWQIAPLWLTVLFWIMSCINNPILIIPCSMVIFYWIKISKKYQLLSIFPLFIFGYYLEYYLRGNLQTNIPIYLSDHGYKTILPYSGLSGFSYPFVLGILNQVFSFGKGVIFYAPGIIVSISFLNKIRDYWYRKMITASIIFSLGLLVVYSKWWSWYGGWFWGPRFLLFISIPASYALAKIIISNFSGIYSKIILFLILFWSFWVGLNGAIFQLKGLDLCWQNNYALEFLCWYSPEYSPLFRSLYSFIHFTTGNYLIIIYSIIIFLYIIYLSKNKFN